MSRDQDTQISVRQSAEEVATSGRGVQVKHSWLQGSLLCIEGSAEQVCMM